MCRREQPRRREEEFHRKDEGVSEQRRRGGEKTAWNSTQVFHKDHQGLWDSRCFGSVLPERESESARNQEKKLSDRIRGFGSNRSHTGVSVLSFGICCGLLRGRLSVERMQERKDCVVKKRPEQLSCDAQKDLSESVLPPTAPTPADAIMELDACHLLFRNSPCVLASHESFRRRERKH
ncbi:hypothetical protein TGMAS_319935 [Toxoplasma gondii MAS]|uniref:Uncharacterized protein n=1 Tax=Toxoplasma gondii MAS TaxID=943118 RepID=A0A086QFE6_TOXGO|nr:hypothetical protein TGMAS_319935 [Toxoplasma gondii MAS]